MNRIEYDLWLIGFGNFRWFRRIVGGRWECWFNFIISSNMWYHREGSQLARPPQHCHGTPKVEDYRLPRVRML